MNQEIVYTEPKETISLKLPEGLELSFSSYTENFTTLLKNALETIRELKNGIPRNKEAVGVG